MKISVNLWLSNITTFETRFNDYRRPIFLWSSFSDVARDANTTILEMGDPSPLVSRRLNDHSLAPPPGLFALWSNKVKQFPNWLPTRVIYEADHDDQAAYSWAEVEKLNSTNSGIFQIEFNTPLILEPVEDKWVGFVETRIQDAFTWNSILSEYGLREFLPDIRVR